MLYPALTHLILFLPSWCVPWMLWRSFTVWWRVLSAVAALLPVSTPPAELLESGCSLWPLSSALAWEPRTLSCATAAFIGKWYCTSLPVLASGSIIHPCVSLSFFWQLSCSFSFSSYHLYNFCHNGSVHLLLSFMPTSQFHENPALLTAGIFSFNVSLH